MSEKRFFTKINKNGRLVIIDKECHIELIDLTLACEVLNRLDLKLKTYNEQLGEQQATINELKERNAHNFAKKMQLMKEIKELKAKLREKEEDEKLYANEIIELRKTNEEWLQFKELGGDY